MIDGMKPGMAITSDDIISLAMLPLIGTALVAGNCGSVGHISLRINTEALCSRLGVAASATTSICSICPGYVQHAQTELCVSRNPRLRLFAQGEKRMEQWRAETKTKYGLKGDCCDIDDIIKQLRPGEPAYIDMAQALQDIRRLPIFATRIGSGVRSGNAPNMVCNVLDDLVTGDIAPSDYGVFSPYSGCDYESRKSIRRRLLGL